MCKIDKDPGRKKQLNNVIIKVRDLPEGSRRGRNLDEVVGVSSGQQVIKMNPKTMRKVVMRPRR